ncbi:MAG: hypothetical protein AB7Q42_05545 [Acidimicrobiia bacterium]
MLAINITKWPGMNQAFLVSFLVTMALTLVVIPFGKRRKVGSPLTWGEAMFAATYAFFVMFLAYGVVPHQWLTHVQNELGWQSNKPVLGPGGIFKSQAAGGSFPFDINYLQVGDALVAGIYGFFLGLQIWMWSWWQKRGATTTTTEVATSTYGRPLVRKA